MTVASLDWLSGDWVAELNGRWTEEHWSHARGGLLLGYSRSGKGERGGQFEFMRIGSAPDGTVTFWGQPQGGPPVAFRLSGSATMEARFENPTHDYPTRIVYRRSGDTLTATISGTDASKPQSWTYRRR